MLVHIVDIPSGIKPRSFPVCDPSNDTCSYLVYFKWSFVHKVGTTVEVATVEQERTLCNQSKITGLLKSHSDPMSPSFCLDRTPNRTYWNRIMELCAYLFVFFILSEHLSLSLPQLTRNISERWYRRELSLGLFVGGQAWNKTCHIRDTHTKTTKN